MGGTAGGGPMALERLRVLSSVGTMRGGPPLAVVHDPMAGAAEPDATASSPFCPERGTVRRDGVSRAREVQTLGAHVTLQPGQNRTHKRLAQYGKPLVCVRDRDDATRQRQLNTMAVIVEEPPCCPGRGARKHAVLVGVRVGVQEVSWPRRVKPVGEVESDSTHLGIATGPSAAARLERSD